MNGEDLQTGIKFEIPLDHPAFAGHFPGRSIVPGVVLLDLVMATLENNPTFSARHKQIRNAKFLAPVGPGAQLELKLSHDARGTLSFTFSQAGQVVASGSLAIGPVV